MLKFKTVLICIIISIFAIGLAAQTPNWLWAQRAGGTDDDATRASVTDAAGNTYITGFFVGSAVFGTATLTGSNFTNCFVAKMDSNGNWLWAKTAEDTGSCEGMGIAVDGSGNVYVVGNFNATATFGAIPLTTGGLIDVFVAKLDSDGTWLWAKQAGGTFNDNAMSIDVDNSGNATLPGNLIETQLLALPR